MEGVVMGNDPGRRLEMGVEDMIPSHHPHPETLVSYAAGTLPNAVACVVGCHLSMCRTCKDEVRWLEMLGGVLLRNLDADDVVLPRTAGRSVQRPVAATRGDRPGTSADEPLLPMPLAFYLARHRADGSWKPADGGVQERSIQLPERSGAIKLLRLSPGQRLPEHDLAAETEVALVLQGACRDGAGIYVRGDIIEWAEDTPRRPLAAGEVECVCLIADQA
jgi:putative transcriptional regulator